MVLLGVVAMLILAMLPIRPEERSLRLEQTLTPRPVKTVTPVAYVPVVTTSTRR